MDSVNKFLKRFSSGKQFGTLWMQDLRPTVFCKDGFNVSIQASATHYARPRDNEGPYEAVELGFPSEEPSKVIMTYAENPDNPTQTVYGWVPVEHVVALLEEHGGIVATAHLRKEEEKVPYP